MSTELVKSPKEKSEDKGEASKSPEYVLDDKFFDIALREGVREALMLPGNFPEKQLVRIKPGFNTACWSFQPPHKIFVGNKLFDKPNIRPGLTEEQQKQYIRNHYHHEKAHALYTERDMVKTKRWLEAIDCAFRLYNLFEDARIEHKYRVEKEFLFEWLTFESLPDSVDPLGLLFSLIQAEGDKSLVQTALDAFEAPAGIAELLGGGGGLVPLTKDERQELLDKVFGYYEKIVATETSLQLFPLLQKWLDEFGRPPEQPGQDMSDLALAAELMTNPDAAESFEENTKPVDFTGQKDDISGKGRQAASDPALPAAQSGTVLGDEPEPVDLVRANALAKKFEGMFQAKARYLRTEVPQNRISAKHYSLGLPFYKRKEVKAPRRKRLQVYVDCSGSMDGHHMDEGKVLVTALSILARKGLVSGEVVLSGVVRGVPSWERYDFPLEQSVIDRFEGHAGGEGLEYSLQANLTQAKAADYVFVYTDAQIGDRAISKEALHRQGVYTWGLYAGDTTEYFEDLLKYFDKAIMRNSAEALVDAMLVQLK